MAHRTRTSMSNINYTNTDRGQNGYTSGSAPLLPSDDHSNRRSLESLEYKEPFQDEEINTYSDKLPLYNNKRSASTTRNRNWMILGVCLLALIGLGWLAKPYAKIPEWSSQPSADLSVSGFSGPRNTFTYLNGTQFNKPRDMKIIGIIFCRWTFFL